MPFGRPTKFKEEMCDIAYGVLSKGGSLSKVAATLEIHYDTLCEWRKIHKDFSDALKLGLVKAVVVWEDSPPEMADSRWIFQMKNRFHWADKQSDRGKQYSESFTREGLSIMMSSGEMSVDTGVKLIELLFKEEELAESDAPINVSIVVKELTDDR